MSADFKAVIFDFDGTLYDNSGIAKSLILMRPHRFFFMWSERKVRTSLKGRDFETPENFKREYYKRAAALVPCSQKRFAFWYESRYLRHMQKALGQKKFRARPKTRELFQALHDRGIKIALYSDYAMIPERAAACGIQSDTLSLCQGIYSSDDFGCLKPAPRAFLQIAANLGARPKDCLVVGDRDDTDGMGARLCGMKFIQIKTKKPRDVLDGSHPVMEWEDFAATILGK